MRWLILYVVTGCVVSMNAMRLVAREMAREFSSIYGKPTPLEGLDFLLLALVGLVSGFAWPLALLIMALAWFAKNVMASSP